MGNTEEKVKEKDKATTGKASEKIFTDASDSIKCCDNVSTIAMVVVPLSAGPKIFKKLLLKLSGPPLTTTFCHFKIIEDRRNKFLTPFLIRGALAYCQKLHDLG